MVVTHTHHTQVAGVSHYTRGLWKCSWGWNSSDLKEFCVSIQLIGKRFHLLYQVTTTLKSAISGQLQVPQNYIYQVHGQAMPDIVCCCSLYPYLVEWLPHFVYMHLKCTVKLVRIWPLLLSVLSSNRIMHYSAGIRRHRSLVRGGEGGREKKGLFLPSLKAPNNGSASEIYCLIS